MLVTFEPVDGRTSLDERLWDCLVVDVSERRRQFIEQGGNMIVQRRNIELLC